MPSVRIVMFVVAVFVFKLCIHESDFLILLIFQKANLSLFLPTAHIEIVSYPVDSVIKFPVDLGNLHFHSAFVSKTAVAIAVVIVIKSVVVLIVTVIIVPAIMISIINIIVPLIEGFIIPPICWGKISSVRLSVVPVAGLCLG